MPDIKTREAADLNQREQIQETLECRDIIIENLEDLLKKKEVRILQQEKMLQAREAALNALEQTLAAIYHSRSWKFVTFLQKLSLLIMPLQSRGRACLRKIVSLVIKAD